MQKAKQRTHRRFMCPFVPETRYIGKLVTLNSRFRRSNAVLGLNIFGNCSEIFWQVQSLFHRKTSSYDKIKELNNLILQDFLSENCNPFMQASVLSGSVFNNRISIRERPKWGTFLRGPCSTIGFQYGREQKTHCNPFMQASVLRGSVFNNRISIRERPKRGTFLGVPCSIIGSQYGRDRKGERSYVVRVQQ